MRRAGIVIALAVVLAVVAAGCGKGGSGSGAGSGQGAASATPTEWAGKICGALVSWETSLATRTQAFASSVAASGSIKDAKAKLVAYLGDAAQLTDAMLSKIQGAGKPDVDHGAQLADDFRAALARTKTVFAQAQTQAKALPTNIGRSDFGRRVQSLGKQIESQGNTLDEAFTQLDKKYNAPELDSAFTSEPSCKKIRSK